MGKGTVLVPAAHGSRPEIDSDPEGVDRPASRRPRLHKNITPTRRTVDPFRVGEINGSSTVGGGDKQRPLAHGYSMLTPAGFRTTLP